MASRNLARSSVAVVSVPKRPSAHKVAPMLESLARLGLQSSDISSLLDKMASFRKTARPAVGRKILLHTKRYAEGYYRENDPEYKEQFRLNTALTLAIYLIKSLERIQNAASKHCDTGVTTLAETAVDKVSEILNPKFFEQDHDTIVSSVYDVLPFVHAALGAANLSEHTLTIPQATEAHKEDVLKMIDAAYVKLYGPEEAA